MVTVLIRALLAMIRWLPLGFFPAVTDALAWLLRPFARRDQRQLRINVQKIYGLPPHSHFSRMFEKQVFRHQIATALETLRSILEPSCLTFKGLESLRTEVARAEALGKGHEIVTAHIGSWELCGYASILASTRPFHALGKPPRHPAARAALNEIREKMGVHVFWTDRKSLLKDMLGAFRRGESVGFVMDQKPEGRQGPKVQFLGRETEFVAGPASMAKRTGAAVISVFVVREAPFVYRILCKTLFEAGEKQEDELVMTQTMASEIERVIRLYPEQWTWNYKRWRFVDV